MGLNFGAETMSPIYNINGYQIGYAEVYGTHLTDKLYVLDSNNLTNELLIKNNEGILVPYCILAPNSLGFNKYTCKTTNAKNEGYTLGSPETLVTGEILTSPKYDSGENIITKVVSEGQDYLLITRSGIDTAIIVNDTDQILVAQITGEEFEELLCNHTDDTEEGGCSDPILVGMCQDDFIAITNGLGVLYNTRTKEFLVLDNDSRSYRIIDLDEVEKTLGVERIEVIDKHSKFNKFKSIIEEGMETAQIYNAFTASSLPVGGMLSNVSIIIPILLVIIATIPLIVSYRLRNNVIMSQKNEQKEDKTEEKTDEHK